MNNAYISTDEAMVSTIVDKDHWLKSICNDQTPYSLELSPEFIEEYKTINKAYWAIQDKLNELARSLAVTADRANT